MSETPPVQQTEEAPPVLPKRSGSGTIGRVARYMAVRIVTLLFTVVVGVFLTIMIANMGGFVDEIRRGDIRDGIAQAANANPAIKNLPSVDRNKWMQDQIALQEKRYGLDKPFLVRTMGYMSNALTLNLGRSQNMSSDSGSRQVRLILLERLPSTLVLFGTSNLLLFFIELVSALSLSRKYGSWLDKVVVSLSPTSAAPAWFYGIFLILIFAAILKVLPFGGMVDAPPPDEPVAYALSLMRHMILPLMALAASQVIVNIYGWRTFFLIYSSEDYVEMAKAKGLHARDVEQRYVLRPTLPTIITSFSFTLIYAWTGAPIFETMFNWPGLGRVTVQAVGLYDTPVIVSSAVIFAYLLGLTVLLLEFLYVLVDPRVKIGQEGSRT
jgi:peptide/nickel transport system permease protein